MDTVRFGTTGLKVSRLCLGCMSYGGPDPRWTWALDEEDSRASIKHALEFTADEIKHLEEPYRPRPVAGHA